MTDVSVRKYMKMKDVAVSLAENRRQWCRTMCCGYKSSECTDDCSVKALLDAFAEVIESEQK